MAAHSIAQCKCVSMQQQANYIISHILHDSMHAYIRILSTFFALAIHVHVAT